MALFRPLITPSANGDGSITVRIDLIQVDENCNVLKDEAGNPKVEFSESFCHKLQTDRGYVSQIGFPNGACGLPPFTLDGEGKRHFSVRADKGSLDAAGKEANLNGPREVLSQ